MKTIHTSTMTNTGGRDGEVFAPDKSLALKIVRPGTEAENGTNPEQLFAAGFASCFNGALSLVLLREKIKAQSTITAKVTLYDKEKQDYFIGVELEGHIEGFSDEETQKFLEKANLVCPYSKATKGNIEVIITAV